MTVENQSVVSYDTIVVGCGPVGAALANHLSLYGHRVAIFDRDKEVFYAPRAMGYDDETLRLFQTLGVWDRICDEKHAYKYDTWTYNKHGRPMFKYDRESLGKELLIGACGHYYYTLCDQPSVERILRKEFDQGTKVDSYLGYEVTAVTDEGKSVKLKAKNLDTDEEVDFEASYVVGCDGGRSFVRRAMDVERIDLGYSEEFLVVDAIVDDKDYFRTRIRDGGILKFHPKHSGVVVKGLHGHVRFDIQRHPDIMPESSKTEEDFAEAAQKLIKAEGYDPKKFRVIRHAPYTFYAGMPAQWRKGRLMVAGDAAHQTPPWSGQGLNMGMRDVSNLAFKLDMVLQGKAPDKVLDTYDAERRPASKETILGAVMNGRNMMAENSLRAVFRDLVFLATTHSKFLTKQAFKAYQRKPPMSDGLVGKKSKLSGKMMIQPKVKDLKGNDVMLDDIIGPRFALITTDSPFGENVYRFVTELGGAAFKLGVEFEDDDDWSFLEWFKKNKISSVLIRPDRYIFDAGKDCDTLCEALFEKLC